MSKKCKQVDWAKVANALTKPKRLHLEKDESDGLFHCPIEACDHDGFGTQRGCRKHVTRKHRWFFYFAQKPSNAEIEANQVNDCNESPKKSKPTSASKPIPTFEPSGAIAKEFLSWLTGSGGGKSDRKAPQIVSKSLKFLRFCCEDEDELTWKNVDYSLCSPNLLFKFADMMQDTRNLGHAGRLGYLDAIGELVQFRKVSEGLSDTVARGLTVTETYLKRVRRTVSKMMRLQWTSDLDIDVLEAKGHWASLDELLEVVSHYLPRYEEVLKKCRDNPGSVCSGDLSFAKKFLAVYLFIKVKGSRPMTYQYLTVDMVRAAKTNGGFIDQKMFKTAGKYGFDSLLLTDTNMKVLDGYIHHIRPLQKPACDYVLVTRNGGQHNKLGELMSKLVFDAIGKYVHPTRYRQIVETASSNQLSAKEQDAVSEDQKHSSVVARVHYQKQRSREVATKARQCLDKLHGDKGTKLEEDVISRLSDISSASSQEHDAHHLSGGSTEEVESAEEALPLKRESNLGEIPRLTRQRAFKVANIGRTCNRKKALLFTQDEDRYLKAGLKRYGYGQWTAILRDSEFHFQKGRSSDSLKKRAAAKFCKDTR